MWKEFLVLHFIFCILSLCFFSQKASGFLFLREATENFLRVKENRENQQMTTLCRRSSNILLSSDFLQLLIQTFVKALTEAVTRRCFLKKLLKNFTKFTGEHLQWGLIFIKLKNVVEVVPSEKKETNRNYLGAFTICGAFRDLVLNVTLLHGCFSRF